MEDDKDMEMIVRIKNIVLTAGISNIIWRYGKYESNRFQKEADFLNRMIQNL